MISNLFLYADIFFDVVVYVRHQTFLMCKYYSNNLF